MKAISPEKWKSSLSKNQIWQVICSLERSKFGRFEIGINSEFDSFRIIHRSSASREYEASFAREQSWNERSPRLKMSTRCWCDWEVILIGHCLRRRETVSLTLSISQLSLECPTNLRPASDWCDKNRLQFWKIFNFHLVLRSRTDRCLRDELLKRVRRGRR